MSDSIKKVSDYGAEFIKNNGLFAKKESISFSYDEIEQIFHQFKENTDVNFIAGFVSAFCNSIIANWGSFTPEQKENIKILVIQNIQVQIPAQYALRLSFFISNLYRMLNSEWKELSSMIFDSESISDVLAYIYIGTFDAFTQEYIQANKEKIIIRTFQYIEKSSITVQLRLMNILCCIDDIKLSDEQLKLLWNYIFDIVNKRPSALIVAHTILTGIFREYTTIQSLQKPEINDSNFNTALRLLFVFTPQQTIEIITKYVENPTQDRVDAFNSEFLDTIQPDQLSAIHDFIFGDNESKVKRLAACAPIIPYLQNTNPKFIENATEILKATSEIEDKSQFFALLKYGSSVLLGREKLQFVSDTLLNLMTKDDETAKTAAEIAISAFKFGIVKTRQHMKAILSKYKEISANLHSQFILALDSLANAEDFDAFLISPLVAFASEILKNPNSSLQEKTSTFTLVCSLAERDENLSSTLSGPLLDNLPALLDGDAQSKQAAMQTIYMLAVMNPKVLSNRVQTSDIDKIMQFTMDESVSSEVRGAIGESLTGYIASIQQRDLYQPLAKLIDSFLLSGNRNLCISGSTMIIIASDCFDGRLAQNVMLSCARAASATDYAPLFNSYVEGLRRLAAANPVDKWHLDFSLDVVIGFVKVAEIEPVSAWYNLRTPLYSYFTTVVQKLGQFAAPLIQYLLDIVADCVDPMVDLVFEPVKRVYEMNLIDDSTKTKLIETCCSKSLTAKSFCMLNFAVNNVADPQSFADNVAESLEIANEDEKNPDDEWRCNLAVAILTLQGRGANFEDDDIVDAVACFPPDAAYKISDEMCSHIIRLCKQENNSVDIKVALSEAAFDFLLLSKQEINQHGIQTSSVAQLRDVFKTVVKSDKEVEKEMTAYCKGVKSKIGKLNQLIR